jgi:hypothetical protein
VDIDNHTKKILLRSRQATSRPSPEPSPTSSPTGSMDNLTQADPEAKIKYELFGREIPLQEDNPETYFEFGSEVWRSAICMNAEYV